MVMNNNNIVDKMIHIPTLTQCFHLIFISIASLPMSYPCLPDINKIAVYICAVHDHVGFYLLGLLEVTSSFLKYFNFNPTV